MVWCNKHIEFPVLLYSLYEVHGERGVLRSNESWGTLCALFPCFSNIHCWSFTPLSPPRRILKSTVISAGVLCHLDSSFSPSLEICQHKYMRFMNCLMALTTLFALALFTIHRTDYTRCVLIYLFICLFSDTSTSFKNDQRQMTVHRQVICEQGTGCERIHLWPKSMTINEPINKLNYGVF